MKERVAVDSWAFLESFLNGPRRQEVEELMRDAEGALTTREIVSETFNFIVGRSRRTSQGLDWLRDMRASRIVVKEPPASNIEEFLGKLPAEATMSYADASLAVAALESEIRAVATADSGFRAAALRPLFSRR